MPANSPSMRSLSICPHLLPPTSASSGQSRVASTCWAPSLIISRHTTLRWPPTFCPPLETPEPLPHTTFPSPVQEDALQVSPACNPTTVNWRKRIPLNWKYMCLKSNLLLLMFQLVRWLFHFTASLFRFISPMCISLNNLTLSSSETWFVVIPLAEQWPLPLHLCPCPWHSSATLVGAPF